MWIKCYYLWTFFVIENNGFLQSPYHEPKKNKNNNFSFVHTCTKYWYKSEFEHRLENISWNQWIIDAQIPSHCTERKNYNGNVLQTDLWKFFGCFSFHSTLHSPLIMLAHYCLLLIEYVVVNFLFAYQKICLTMWTCGLYKERSWISLLSHKILMQLWIK